MSVKRTLVEPNAKSPSLRRQCALLGLNRSSWYIPASVGDESAENQRLMDRINAIYRIMNGGNILVLQRILGHQSLTMTLRLPTWRRNTCRKLPDSIPSIRLTIC